jgi:hypothetical protein
VCGQCLPLALLPLALALALFEVRAVPFLLLIAFILRVLASLSTREAQYSSNNFILNSCDVMRKALLPVRVKEVKRRVMVSIMLSYTKSYSSSGLNPNPNLNTY